MGNVLVTGGAGFLGSHLVDQLLGRGQRVRVLDNLSTGSLHNLQAAADRQSAPIETAAGAARPGPRLELMIGDIRDENLVRKAMQHVECVFHLAALPASAGSPTAPSEIHTVNVHGTLNVLQAATAEGARRVIFASCASVYGAAEMLPIGEHCVPQPVSVFGASKLGGEVYGRAYQRAHHLETVALRYFTLYGPRQNGLKDGALVPTLIETLRSRRRPIIFGDGRAAQDFLFVDDAVAATLAAADAPEAAGLAINVGSGQMASVNEVLDILKRLLRTDLVPRLGRPRAGQAPPIRAQIALAERVLGWTPRVSLVSGLARAVQSFTDADDESLLAEVGPREQRADV
jgi:UDP-N-acetylglucosamine/UDP-N-acetyl-alpha-D-glucosaminouronate 4-epimerase